MAYERSLYPASQHQHPDVIPPLHEMDRYSLLAHATTEISFQLLARPGLKHHVAIFHREPTDMPDDTPNQDPRAAEIYWRNFNQLEVNPEQRLILPYVSNGFTNPEIAEQLRSTFPDTFPNIKKEDITYQLRHFFRTQSFSSRTRLTSRLAGLSDEPPEVIPEPKNENDYQVEYALHKRLLQLTMDEKEYQAVNLILRGWTREETMERTGKGLSFVRASVDQVGKPLGTKRAAGLLARVLKFSFSLPQHPYL